MLGFGNRKDRILPSRTPSAKDVEDMKELTEACKALMNSPKLKMLVTKFGAISLSMSDKDKISISVVIDKFNPNKL